MDETVTPEITTEAATTEVEKRSDAWYAGHGYAMRDVALIFNRDDITLDELVEIRKRLDPKKMTIDEIIKEHTIATLEKNDFNVSRTSRELDVDRRTLYRWLVRWNVKLPRSQAEEQPEEPKEGA